MNYRRCKKHRDVAAFSVEVLRKWKGIRFTNNISGWLDENFAVLDSGQWQRIRDVLDALKHRPGVTVERESASVLIERLKGIGQKQFRNILQSPGLTQHEIPIDSRIAKWLNTFGFPVHLSAIGLSDRSYYEFVSDGIHALCAKAGVLPCILDAAIFVSFDDGSWTEENLVW